MVREKPQLIVQGVEAGGHVHGMVSDLVLVEQLVRAVSLLVSRCTQAFNCTEFAPKTQQNPFRFGYY